MKNLRYLKPEAVKLLVVHCSGNRCDHELTVGGLIATGNARFGQPSYHYYVRRNGAVVPILPESVQGIHAKNYNHCSLGICYEGGLNAKVVAEDTWTEAQKHALYALLKCLRADYPKCRIVGHCELPHMTKPCPCFPASKEYAELQPK